MLNPPRSARPFTGRSRLLAANFFIGALLTMSTNPVYANTTPGALPTDAEGFYFLEGQWRVHNRKLQGPSNSSGGKEEWIEFEARAQ